MSTRGADRGLLASVIVLALFGITVLYSAGQTDVPTNATGAWTRQLAWMGLGVIVALLVSRVSFRILEWAAPGIWVLSLGILGLTLLLGTGGGGAASSRSWLTVAGIRLGQPSELAKIATILFLAKYLTDLREAPQTLRALIRPALIAGIPFLLVMVQPDLGSAIVFVGIFFAMLFWAGVRPSLLLLLASPVISLLLAVDTRLWAAWMILLFLLLVAWRRWVGEGVFVYVVNSAMGVLAIMLWNRLKPYQQQRLITFINPESDPVRSGYQAIQSRVAVGSGGWTGNGFLEGPQKRLAFIPEQHTDFIFPIVGEELGFLGVSLALALFLALLFAVIRIAREAVDPFGSLVAFGVLGLFATHIIENVGMTVNLMPITGIPLPFFSYGGSFVLTTAIGIGLVLRAAQESRRSSYLVV